MIYYLKSMLLYYEYTLLTDTTLSLLYELPEFIDYFLIVLQVVKFWETF